MVTPTRWTSGIRRPAPPATVFDDAMQQERTALAWERTSVSLMVVGALITREAAVRDLWPFIVAGMAGVLVGVAVLVWAGVHYAQLHETLRRGEGAVHPLATRVLGLASIIGIGMALLLSVAVVLA